MRITSKGQVTIPQWIREETGFLPHTEIDFEVDGSAVRIVRAKQPRKLTRGQLAVELLRQARHQNKLTTDEIMAMTRGEE